MSLTEKEKEFVQELFVNNIDILFNGIKEKDINTLKSIIDRLDARCEELEKALGDIIDEIAVPDADCHCHIVPPCNDCVEYSHLRDLISQARQALNTARPAKAKEGLCPTKQ